MQALHPPGDSALNTFRACVGIVRNHQLRARFTSVENEIVTASANYEVVGQNGQLFTIASSNNVGGVITTKEMTELYNERMVRTGTPGRDYYDRIIAAPAHGKCPLCAHRPVSTLDHHLAKGQHPAFAVSPLNLVPSCSDCNKAKEHHFPETADEQTLHPYFDNIEDFSWLTAQVQETSPASLVYEVADAPEIDEVLLNRIREHFTVLELGKLYAANAGAEIVNIRLALKMIFDSNGSEDVVAHLQRQAMSYTAVNTNSWQSVMYRALAANAWYSTGGFD